MRAPARTARRLVVPDSPVGAGKTNAGGGARFPGNSNRRGPSAAPVRPGRCIGLYGAGRRWRIMAGETGRDPSALADGRERRVSRVNGDGPEPGDFCLRS